MAKFPTNAIFVRYLIFVICMVNWCNPAFVKTNVKTEEISATPAFDIDVSGQDARVLVFDQTHNTLMPAHHNSSLYVDQLNMMLAQLPLFKLGIVNSVLTFVIPSLHIVLILSLIAFSITGTVALACSVFDCGELLGFAHGHSHGHGHNHRPYASTFLRENFRTSHMNDVQPYYNYPAKYWNQFDATQNLLDEAYDKFEE